jgi:type II secretory pathway component PulC
MKSPGKKTLLVFLILALCGGGIGLSFRSVRHHRLPPAAASQKPPRPEPIQVENAPKAGQDTADYQIILDRNLFGKSAAAPKSAGPQEQRRTLLAGLPPTSLNISLLGTIFSDTEEKRAIILDNDQKSQESYRVGDAIQGAVIKDILRGAVVLEVKNRNEMLEMSETKDQSPPLKTGAASPGTQKTVRGTRR